MGEPSLPKRGWGGQSLRSSGSWGAGDPGETSQVTPMAGGGAQPQRGRAGGEGEGQEQGPGGWGGSCPLQRRSENPGRHVGHCSVEGLMGFASWSNMH